MRLLLVALALLTRATVARAGDNGILEPVGSIPMEGTKGRIDHLAVSSDGKDLFVAALASDMVEQIDTERRTAVAQIRGISEPQGVYYIARSQRLIVASGGDGSVHVYDRNSKLVGTVALLEDADNVRYDPRDNLLYVGYRRGALAIIDPDKVVKVGDIPLDGHPESFQLERLGQRIFVNVPSAGEVEVVDREKRLLLKKWKLTAAAANFPMALDETNRRLFVGCRMPARLLVLDALSGKIVANMKACGDADVLFYDSLDRMIYLSGGAGCVNVFYQVDSNTLRELRSIDTPSGARTSLFVPSTRTLYVAVPGHGSQQAQILVFNAVPGSRAGLVRNRDYIK